VTRTAQARREALLDRLADQVLAQGLAASSLRPLARAAGTSDRMLLYYFKDKADLMSAILERLAERLGAQLHATVGGDRLPFDGLRGELLQLTASAALWPYMRLWLEIAALAARGDPLYRQIGGAIARGFLAWGAARLDCEIEAARETQAAWLLADVESALLLKSVGLEDVSRLAITSRA
jgi:AcrR family transcriptional regulator